MHYVRPCTIEPYTGGPCENFGLYEMLRNSLLHRFFFFSFLLVSAIQNQNATTETQTSHQTIGNHFVSGQCGVVNNIIILLHSPIVVCSVFALRRRNRVKKKRRFLDFASRKTVLKPPPPAAAYYRFVHQIRLISLYEKCFDTIFETTTAAGLSRYIQTFNDYIDQ